MVDRHPKRVLIVDDDPSIAQIIQRALSLDAEMEVVTSGEDALAACRASCPAIVLLDISLPGMDGFETCRRLKIESDDQLQVIMITAESSNSELEKAFDAGADDYIAKPFDQLELRSRVRLLLRLQEANHHAFTGEQKIASYDRALKQLSKNRTSELLATQDVTVFALAKLAELRDADTGGHLLRMRSYSVVLSETLKRNRSYSSEIDVDFISNLYRSSPLHDVGKVGIPDDILLKPGKLSVAEFEVMKTHTTIGADVLQEASACSRCGGFLKMAVEIARFHHERFDGSGYPLGLKGHNIPLSARIVAIADVFDALTSERPYKKAFSPEIAKQIIEQKSGKHFDPLIVEAFRECYSQFLEIIMSNDPATDTSLPQSAASSEPDNQPWIYSSFADDEFFEELIQEYVTAMPERVDQLKSTHASAEKDELRRLVHQIKGAAGSYGFDQITPVASNLEESLQSNSDEDAIEELLAELVSLCSRIRVKDVTVEA